MDSENITLSESLQQIRDHSAASLAVVNEIRQNADNKDIQSALEKISRSELSTLEAIDEINGKMKSRKSRT